MKKFVNYVFIGLGILLVGGCLLSFGSLGHLADQEMSVDEDSILVLSLEGVITDGKEFVSQLHRYAKKKKIKAVLVRINSPGGVVGGSQEIYTELKRVREELNKPVVVSCNSIAASGGYYAAVAADRIITNPGAMLGSIGVILQFANLERLYDWAKMKRMVITTGPYKDSGSDHRPMRDDERVLFQAMIDQVHEQFKQAVANGRKLSVDVVDKYADGRVFTGQTAVSAGFADQLGSFRDAVKVAAELGGIGGEPNLFEPKSRREMWREFLGESSSNIDGRFDQWLEQLVKLKISGQPLYLMPGAFGF